MNVGQLKSSVGPDNSFLWTTYPQERALSVLIKMKRHGIHHMPVLNDGEFIGMVSDRAILDRALSMGMGDELSWLSIREAMQRNVPVIDRQTELTTALRHMRKGRFSALPIVDAGAVCGVLTESDILEFMARALEVNEDPIVESGSVMLSNPLTQKLMGMLADVGI